MALSPATGIRSGAGFRSCTLFALNEAGLPAATSASTPYLGVRLYGGKVLTVTDPEPRKIFHTGDDSILVSDLLPPQEGISAELHAGRLNDIIDALVTNQKTFSVGETALFGGGTDMRGFENQVGLLAYQHAPDGDVEAGTSGLGGWSGLIFPKAYIFQRESGFSDQAADRSYSVMPMIVSSHLWGVAFAPATEGFSRAQYIRTYGRGKPVMMAWKGNNTVTAFTFPTDKPALSVNKVQVWVNGAPVVSPAITVTTASVTFTAAPALNAIVVVLYEY